MPINEIVVIWCKQIVMFSMGFPTSSMVIMRDWMVEIMVISVSFPASAMIIMVCGMVSTTIWMSITPV